MNVHRITIYGIFENFFQIHFFYLVWLWHIFDIFAIKCQTISYIIFCGDATMSEKMLRWFIDWHEKRQCSLCYFLLLYYVNFLYLWLMVEYHGLYSELLYVSDRVDELIFIIRVQRKKVLFDSYLIISAQMTLFRQFKH